MSGFLAGQQRPASVTTWADPVIAPSLCMAAESLCVFGGFLVVSIAVVRDDMVHNVAVSGAGGLIDPTGAPAPLPAFLDVSFPVKLAERLLASAERWGALHFLDQARGIYRNEWTVDHDYRDAEWDVHSALAVPVRDSSGSLRGLIRLDGPVDGRVPDEDAQTRLNEYAAQAARVLLTALEREDYADKLRLAETARQALARASGTDSPRETLGAVADGIVGGLGLLGLRATLFDGDVPKVFASSGTVVDSEHPRLQAIRVRVARYAWEHHTVAITTATEQIDFPLVAGDDEFLRALFAELDASSILVTPLGSGTEVLGALTLYRRADMPDWSPAERAIAQEIGRDLGRVLGISRALELEREAAERLRELDAYKSQLIATVAHELKNPIAAIRVNLEDEMLRSPEAAANPALVAIDRGAARATALIDELLQLAAASDPSNFPLDEIELVELVREAVAQVPSSERVRLEAPSDGLVLTGNRPGLQTVVTNLVTNALKYSDEDGVVSVAVRARADDVELTVTDHGLGIAPEEQELIFQEFFRSSNPQARRRPGTGLGLAIADRVVQRHHGRIIVESELGEGSTFHVALPRTAG
ncbi:MAG: sensor histidine kinase [Nocardioides sp.]